MQPYTFRFDVSHSHEARKTLRKWLKSQDFEDTILAQEHGSLTGKEHYQGLLHSKKNIETIRRHRPFDNLTGTQYSLSVCKDVKKYESYLGKESIISYTGYTEEYIKNIPVWIDNKPAVKKRHDSFLNKLTKKYKDQFGTNCHLTPIDKIHDFVLSEFGSEFKCVDHNIYNKTVNGLLLAVQHVDCIPLKKSLIESYKIMYMAHKVHNDNVDAHNNL